MSLGVSHEQEPVIAFEGIEGHETRLYTDAEVGQFCLSQLLMDVNGKPYADPEAIDIMERQKLKIVGYKPNRRRPAYCNTSDCEANCVFVKSKTRVEVEIASLDGIYCDTRICEAY